MKKSIFLFLLGLLMLGCGGTAKVINKDLQNYSTKVMVPLDDKYLNKVVINPRWVNKDNLEIDFFSYKIEAKPVFGAAINLLYDPNILEYIDYKVGDFLEGGDTKIQGQKPVYLVSPGKSSIEGKVGLIVGISLFRGVSGVKGPGRLISLNFKSREPVPTEIIITKGKLKGLQADDITEISWPTFIPISSPP